MNTVSLKLLGGESIMTWWPILAGLMVLYLPTYYDLANGLWNSDDYAHGPIILVVSLFLIWQQRMVFIHHAPSRPTPTQANTG